jgi:hypothetical protein
MAEIIKKVYFGLGLLVGEVEENLYDFDEIMLIVALIHADALEEAARESAMKKGEQK